MGLRHHVRMDRDWVWLGKALKAARQAAGLTQEELAIDLGVSRSVVQGIERGKEFNKPTQTIRSFARRVGWTDDSVGTVLAGGEPTIAGGTPAAPASPPAAGTQLPLRIVDELSNDGTLLDTVVVPLGGDVRMVVVVKGRPDAGPEEIRKNLEAWRATHQHLLELVEVEWDGGDEPPSVANEA